VGASKGKEKGLTCVFPFSKGEKRKGGGKKRVVQGERSPNSEKKDTSSTTTTHGKKRKKKSLTRARSSKKDKKKRRGSQGRRFSYNVRLKREKEKPSSERKKREWPDTPNEKRGEKGKEGGGREEPAVQKDEHL